ncbi:hypothetical protein LINPERPRIM_LOCUS30428 [Linum perenne]
MASRDYFSNAIWMWWAVGSLMMFRIFSKMGKSCVPSTTHGLH